ncbi:hypothetical protein C4559_05395, partial [Candidatus Microgenomates bacterium]
MGNIFKTHSHVFGIFVLVIFTVSTFLIIVTAQQNQDLRQRAATTTVKQKSIKKIVKNVLGDTNNLVTNGDFSNADQSWTFDNYDRKTHSIENNILVLQSNNKSIQGVKQNITLYPNKTYRISARGWLSSSLPANRPFEQNSKLSVCLFSVDQSSLMTCIWFDGTSPETKESTLLTVPQNNSGNFIARIYSALNIDLPNFNSYVDDIGVFEEAAPPTPTSATTPNPSSLYPCAGKAPGTCRFDTGSMTDLYGNGQFVEAVTIDGKG